MAKFLGSAAVVYSKPFEASPAAFRRLERTEALYALTFEPILQARLWGGRSLERLGRKLPLRAGDRIGESWDLVDLPAGVCGTPAQSIVANGPLAGTTLNELIRRFDRTFVGSIPLGHPPQFPLLIKFLDARENLSVQVHPDRLYAAAHPGVFVKDEAWYVVDAEPGACIYKGLRPGTRPEALREAIRDHTVEKLLNCVPVKAGDCHYLRSGTCHALGAGILAAEVQTTSDTTFRLYDWGRGRELHVEEAMACINFDPQTVPPDPALGRFRRGDCEVEPIMRCGSFTIDRIGAAAGAVVPLRSVGEPVIWIVVGGRGRIVGEIAVHDVPIAMGQTMLFPALMESSELHVEETMAWLEVRRPH